MIRVVLAGLRATQVRLLATALAVALSVGFVVATLTLSATFTHTTEESLTASMAKADVVVTPEVMMVATSDPRTSTDVLLNVLPDVQAAPGVTGADVERLAYVDLRRGDTRSVAQLNALLDGSVRWQELASGRWPAALTEATLDRAAAESMGLGEGDTVSMAAAGSGISPTEVTIVGITEKQAAGVGTGAPTLIMQAEALADPGLFALSTSILVAGPPAAAPAAASDAAADALAVAVTTAVQDAAGLEVQTRAETLDHQTQSLSGSATVVTSILLAFATVALFVAAIVIANTFQVLVSQRTKELALLRCIGASAGQVRTMILTEALLLGVLASALGVGIGLAGSTALTELSQDGASGLHLGELVIDPALLGIGFAVGVLLTLGSALSPAHRATRVRPVAAMRAIAAPASVRRGVVGAVVAVALTMVGGVGLVIGATRSGLALATVSGVVSFIGILLCSALFIPWIVRAAGATIGWTSVPARLAALNATRNPARTASTAAALLVGVTLVTMMVVGVTSVRDSISDKIDQKRPVDLTVQTVDPAGMTPDQIAELSDLTDVTAATSVTAARIRISPAAGEPRVISARGLNTGQLRQVARSSVVVPDPGQLLMNPADAGVLHSGDTVTVAGDAGSVTLTVALAEGADRRVASLTTDDLGRAAAPVTKQVRLRVADDVTSSQVQELSTAILSVSEQFTVGGGAPERTYYEQILDLMLLIVLALLTMAVVIACVGVANTMALSVFERRRESALMRALGLTRGQLRGMLGLEATLITLVAAACGIGLGVFYAWAGLSAVSLQAAKLALTLHLPWEQLALVLAGALAAGLLATVVPASSAARRSPVAGLMHE